MPQHVHLPAVLEEFRHLGVRFVSVQNQIDVVDTLTPAASPMSSTPFSLRRQSGMLALAARRPR